MMLIEKILSKIGADGPDSLLGLLHKTALTSFVLILAVTGFGIHQVYESYVVRSAEEDAVRISKLILAREENLLIDSDHINGHTRQLNSEGFLKLDQALRVFLQPFSILKIKVFNTDGIIIYSTDPTIIGEDSSDSPLLARSLLGDVDSKLQTKDSMHNLKFEEQKAIDVVETYVPIYDHQQNIIGSFELYKDITSYRHEIRSGVITSIAILASILILIFSMSHLVLRLSFKQLREAQRKLEHLASTDVLTGLMNRREIMNRSELEFIRHKRAFNTDPDAVFCVIMIDIDHFKKVNDRYGHPAGDEVLRRFASLLTDQLRSYSFLGRYGGEEFLILLPDTNRQEAMMVAERLRLAVKYMKISVEDNDLTITLSLGVSAVSSDDKDFDQILLRADHALYMAKEAGRDQVKIEINPGLPELQRNATN
ncbi:MAG: GGDEF domain-containing protein [Motiliproteus sp.]